MSEDKNNYVRGMVTGFKGGRDYGFKLGYADGQLKAVADIASYIKLINNYPAKELVSSLKAYLMTYSQEVGNNIKAEIDERLEEYK